MKFEVQTAMCGYWENCWMENDQALRFDAYSEASEALNEHLKDLEDAGMDFDKSDYRIRRVA